MFFFQQVTIVPKETRQVDVVQMNVVHHNHIPSAWKTLEGVKSRCKASCGQELVALFAIVGSEFDANRSVVTVMAKEQVVVLHLERVREALLCAVLRSKGSRVWMSWITERQRWIGSVFIIICFQRTYCASESAKMAEKHVLHLNISTMIMAWDGTGQHLDDWTVSPCSARKCDIRA